MDENAVRDILGIYAKHGWTLRRVLLSEANLPFASSFGNAEIQPSSIDAAWFSRERNDGGTAWEIRYLGPTPYALVTVVDDENALEEELERLASDLASAVSRRPKDD